MVPVSLEDMYPKWSDEEKTTDPRLQKLIEDIIEDRLDPNSWVVVENGKKKKKKKKIREVKEPLDDDDLDDDDQPGISKKKKIKRNKHSEVSAPKYILWRLLFLMLSTQFLCFVHFSNVYRKLQMVRMPWLEF